jgi:hypothetical protein
MDSNAYVFWPDGERETFVLDSSRLGPKGSANAKKILTILSIAGSMVRASVATGRAQTLTSIPSPEVNGHATSLQAVSIADGDTTLAIVVAMSGHDDVAALKAGLKIMPDEHRAWAQRVESILSDVAGTPAIAVVTFGTKTNPAVDEAYGLALYLGATMNEGHSAPA